MQRALVLMLCLGAAAAIGGYSYYSRRDPREPVYTVPAPPSTPTPHASKWEEPRHIDPDNVAALTRELQRELKRVGCYNGEVTGYWTASSRLAMKAFVESVNAALPVDRPDAVLLSLVQSHRERVCVPTAVMATTDKEAPSDSKPDAVATEPQGAPPETKPERRPRQSSQQPPKVVRDFMKAFGF